MKFSQILPISGLLASICTPAFSDRWNDDAFAKALANGGSLSMQQNNIYASALKNSFSIETNLSFKKGEVKPCIKNMFVQFSVVFDGSLLSHGGNMQSAINTVYNTKTPPKLCEPTKDEDEKKPPPKINPTLEELLDFLEEIRLRRALAISKGQGECAVAICLPKDVVGGQNAAAILSAISEYCKVAICIDAPTGAFKLPVSFLIAKALAYSGPRPFVVPCGVDEYCEPEQLAEAQVEFVVMSNPFLRALIARAKGDGHKPVFCPYDGCEVDAKTADPEISEDAKEKKIAKEESEADKKKSIADKKAEDERIAAENKIDEEETDPEKKKTKKDTAKREYDNKVIANKKQYDKDIVLSVSSTRNNSLTAGSHKHNVVVRNAAGDHLYTEKTMYGADKPSYQTHLELHRKYKGDIIFKGGNPKK